MDCYDIEIQRVYVLVEEQVYATWIDYGIVTNMGAKKEVLMFSPAATCSTYHGGRVCMDAYAHLNSPGGVTVHGRLYHETGESKGGGNAWNSFGARPVLYH